ncbi:hypothetical protein H4R27_001638 [Coemansia aciculifera]|nr:hypothetical protein H4R27_001638 [Coemansia aciculifera]
MPSLSPIQILPQHIIQRIRVKQLVPMVNKVSIRSNEPGEMEFLLEDEYFGDLASHLYQLASRISYTTDASFSFMELQSDLINSLTSLEYECDIDSVSNMVQVAQRSAQTLQRLTLAYQLQIDIADLVQSPGGDYVEYPCLNTLFLDLQAYPSFSPLSVDSGVVLFPSLRNLNIGNDYPFGDDALFRGNAATLEYLRVAPGREFCNIVRRYKVFTPTSHPKLRWVESVRLSVGMETQFASTESHLRFMLNIAPNAAVKVIPAVPAGEETFLALNQLTDHTCIQVLHLYDTQLMLWEVIHIVKSLSILSDLVCKSTGLGTYFEDITLDMLPVYVRDIQVPLRERFRCWRLGNVDSNSLEETVTCILVVAMTFPNFRYANLPNSILHEYMELMEETIESDEYVEAALFQEFKEFLAWKAWKAQRRDTDGGAKGSAQPKSSACTCGSVPKPAVPKASGSIRGCFRGLGSAKVNSAKYTRTKLSPTEIDHIISQYNKKVPNLNEIMAAAEDNGTMPSDAEFDCIAAQCGNKAPSWAKLRKLYPPGQVQGSYLAFSGQIGCVVKQANIPNLEEDLHRDEVLSQIATLSVYASAAFSAGRPEEAIDVLKIIVATATAQEQERLRAV